MFVGDRANQPASGGTLYAAMWRQTSPDGSDGGSADLGWVRLGVSKAGEIKALIDKGITLANIFETSLQAKSSKRCWAGR